MPIDYVGADAHVKCGIFRSNGYRDIRPAGFVSNERTDMTKRISIVRITEKTVSHKKKTKLGILISAGYTAQRTRITSIPVHIMWGGT